MINKSKLRKLKMKLNIFQRWKPVAKWGDFQLEMKTERVKNTFVTHIRDKVTGVVVTRGHGPTEDKSQQYAGRNLQALGLEGVRNAVQSGQAVQPNRDLKLPEQPTSVDWWDGHGHSARAQKRLVGESIEWDENVDPDIKDWFTKKGLKRA